LKTLAKELEKYKLKLVEMWEVICNSCCTHRTHDYTFISESSFGKGNNALEAFDCMRESYEQLREHSL
jgi:hypothetical protein